MKTSHTALTIELVGPLSIAVLLWVLISASVMSQLTALSTSLEAAHPKAGTPPAPGKGQNPTLLVCR